MKLKLDENGKPVFENDLPVYVHDDGKEIPFDAARALTKISELGTESKSHRERAEKAEQVVKAFEGVDVEAAKKAIQAVSALEGDKAKVMENLERVKKEISDAWQAKYDTVNTELGQIKAKLSGTVLDAAFSKSKFAAEELLIPTSFVRSEFSRNFKVDGDVVQCIGADGNPILSRKSPGSVAGFDEALEILVENHPDRNRIRKSAQKSGAGNGKGTDGSSGSEKTWSREQYTNASPEARTKFFGSGGTLSD